MTSSGVTCDVARVRERAAREQDAFATDAVPVTAAAVAAGCSDVAEAAALA